jgi:hypothetical protein
MVRLCHEEILVSDRPHAFSSVHASEFSVAIAPLSCISAHHILADAHGHLTNAKTYGATRTLYHLRLRVDACWCTPRCAVVNPACCRHLPLPNVASTAASDGAPADVARPSAHVADGWEEGFVANHMLPISVYSVAPSISSRRARTCRWSGVAPTEAPGARCTCGSEVLKY